MLYYKYFQTSIFYHPATPQNPTPQHRPVQPQAQPPPVPVPEPLPGPPPAPELPQAAPEPVQPELIFQFNTPIDSLPSLEDPIPPTSPGPSMSSPS